MTVKENIHPRYRKVPAGLRLWDWGAKLKGITEHSLDPYFEPKRQPKGAKRWEPGFIMEFQGARMLLGCRANDHPDEEFTLPTYHLSIWRM